MSEQKQGNGLVPFNTPRSMPADGGDGSWPSDIDQRLRHVENELVRVQTSMATKEDVHRVIESIQDNANKLQQSIQRVETKVLEKTNELFKWVVILGVVGGGGIIKFIFDLFSR